MTVTSKPLLLSSAAKNAGSQTKSNIKQRYILMHPNNAVFPDPNISIVKSRRLNDLQNITFADLTTDQALELKDYLTTVNGHIKVNSETKLELDIPEVSAGAVAKKKAASPYPTAPIACSKVKIDSNIVLFFPDSMVTAKSFPNVNLSFGNNYSGSPVPCNPHGDHTLSVFEQVLGDTSMSVTNIPVFNCLGGVTDEASINALLDILDFKKSYPLKKVAMFYAVNPLMPNATISAITQELVQAGVLVGLAAGNQGNPVCNSNRPPQDVDGALQIGATHAPGNSCPWWTNWSDVVPNERVGDCVQAYLPGVFKSKKFGVLLQGTSYAIPQAMAWAVRWWSKNPTANAADVISAFKNHTVTITKKPNKNGPPGPPYTDTGKMAVVTTKNYCNINVSSKPRP